MKTDALISGLISLAKRTGFSGDISIFRGGDTLFHDAFGFRDIANGIRNNADTRFGIASGTKVFTALAILKLVECGELDLSTPATSLFDTELSFIHPTATIRHLLSHTSGIFDYYDEELITDFDNYAVEIPWFRLETPSDYWPLFESRLPKFKPGHRWSYSNGGYVFLGIVVEKITGRFYRDFVADEVLRPAGMDNSGFYSFDALPPNTANGYISGEGDGKSNIYQLPIRGGGDGGMYTTSGDLRSFWNRLLADQIIPPALVEQMQTKQSVLWDKVDYGLGVYIGELDGHCALFASGADAGVGFTSRFVPALRLNWNVLSNRTDGANEISRYLTSNMSV